ncbi:uncharacterized protein LOC126998176 [Eriocheir sinensis]|uniref:uncharacterized protein LOC126998176 n=1 Tax=Eriocheir sinensis TaxID=95602 RepID=UPI0021C67F46|nr:uncharacterized protein LOC126998176 [Eriocheir sinensis]XP_050715577.1 uncharacterized protein LOC126998176 [Eriocheir sinensis]XP_050715578.1 uncharacterized protein LOC126998176 [Eriocheir sinensis]XP_050715579.1 uncharacterized protein LOC126998176 [Eriocheir sinensis]
MAAVLWVVAVAAAVGGSGVCAQMTSDLPPVTHSHRIVLDQDGVFVMLWTPRDDAIDMELQVGAKGYVGLGFSPNGGMKGADIVLGWVDVAGKVFLHDCYAEGNWAPKVDASQDVKLLGGYQNDTHTVLRFSRPWQTLDTKNDFMLGDDTVRVIWAYSNNDPPSKANLNYHEARGTKSLYLKSPQFVMPPMGPDVKTLDLMASNVSLPDDLDTLYWCKLLKMPNITTKHHIIGYIPLAQKENLEHFHHAVIYECMLPDGERHYEKWVDWEGFQCHTPNMPPSWRLCNSPIVAWAIGGEGEMFPEHVGFPMGEADTTYFMMEIHYDNPNLKKGVVDSSGIRLFYTDQLRQHDAGTILFGHSVSPLHIIPPAQKWLTAGYCDASCTRQHLPAEGITLFQGLLHAHLLGTAISLRHGRDGEELPPVMEDMNYDFNYQNTRILREEVTVLPGDTFIVDCAYDSSNRTTTTFGGLGTNEEMCVVFMSYYPRVDLSYCLSQPDPNTVMDVLGIEEASNIKNINEWTTPKGFNEEEESQLLEKVMSGNFSAEATPTIIAYILNGINITAPSEFFNRSLYNILQDRATWDDQGMTNALQQAVLEGNHNSVCYLRSQGKLTISDTVFTAPSLKPLPKSLPVVSFMHSAVLDQQGSVVMLWSPREEDIVFEIQAGAKGYVGLGFSPNGGMKGADIVLGWVDAAGEVFLHDTYADGNMAPKVDASQDVTLLGGYQNDTHTVIRFSRPWNTCDEGQDVLLSDDTVRVIWAYSNTDPASETDLKYHAARGTKSLYLKSPQLVMPQMGPDVKTWDFLSPNVSLPDNLDTLYWCKIFKMPPTPVKSHMIGYVPVVQQENAEHVHHVLFYECYVPDSDTHFEKWVSWEGTQCYSANMPNSWNYCKSVVIAWGVGGEGEMFPEHTGTPMGEEHGGATYFMMEMHYDNPNLRQGVVDSSGIRIFYTENLREYDSGTLMFGQHVFPSIIIPPGQPRFLAAGFCDTTCTQQMLPKEGVKIFQGVLHSHLLGTSLFLRHIRDGQELPVIMKDTSYDFNYQSTRVFQEEVTVLPGDILITECYYDSSNRSKPTFAGLGTEEEMCLAFLNYYPRVDLFSCLSQPTLMSAIGALGVRVERGEGAFKPKPPDEQTNKEMDERLLSEDFNQELKPVKFNYLYKAMRATAPDRFVNMSVYDVLHDETTWQDPTVTDSLQRMETNGVHLTECRKRDANSMISVRKMVPYPTFRTLRPQPDQCLDSQGVNSRTRLCPAFFPFCKNTKRRPFY